MISFFYVKIFKINLFALHWGHFCQWHFNIHSIQSLQRYDVIAKSKQYFPLKNKNMNANDWKFTKPNLNQRTCPVKIYPALNEGDCGDEVTGTVFPCECV